MIVQSTLTEIQTSFKNSYYRPKLYRSNNKQNNNNSNSRSSIVDRMDRTSSRIRFEKVSDILETVTLLPTKIKSLQHSLWHVVNTKQKEKLTKK